MQNRGGASDYRGGARKKPGYVSRVGNTVGRFAGDMASNVGQSAVDAGRAFVGTGKDAAKGFGQVNKGLMRAAEDTVGVAAGVGKIAASPITGLASAMAKRLKKKK